MPKSFNGLRIKGVSIKDPRVAMRGILGFLAVLNVIAALVVFKPWGGSPEDMAREREALERQVVDAQKRLDRSRQLVGKVQQARAEGDRFLADYMMDRRSTYSTIVAELDRAASGAGIKPRERSINLEEVEGSDTILQMTITSGYEGTYANLTKFVNLLDKSPRFLVIETLQAAPQQGNNLLNISIKMDTFVRQLPGAAS
jgi:type IV pilus assembly protein PilO